MLMVTIIQVSFCLCNINKALLDEVTLLQVIECGNKYPTTLALSHLPGTKSK